MAEVTETDIREKVRDRYAAAAKAAGEPREGGCCGPAGCGPAGCGPMGGPMGAPMGAPVAGPAGMPAPGAY